MDRVIDTIVIGGGQAGLSASYYLSQRGKEHVVLEKSSMPGSVWRDDRWDSFTLVTPNWSIALPGGEYSGDDPDGYLPRDQIIAMFLQYTSGNSLPLQYGVEVTAVLPVEGGFQVESNRGAWVARNVIVATGLYQRPRLPAWSAAIPAGVYQVASGKYCHPGALPPGAVLVVGSGQSGCQITEELYQSGRRVYLSVGRGTRAPRHYRGRDIFAWLRDAGFFDQTPDKLPNPQARFTSNPQLSGKNGGHSLNLHQFYRDGVQLLGHALGCSDGLLRLAPDLKDCLAATDKVELDLLNLVDGYIHNNHLDIPGEKVEALADAYLAPEVTSLDLKKSGITSVIWASGYTFDYSMVKASVFDEAGFPVTRRGSTAIPGLYFLGMPWLYTRKSGIFMGVGEDAAYLVESLK